MKGVVYTLQARKAFRKLPATVQAQLEAKLDRYAETGAGDVKTLQGRAGARLRNGDFRIVFVETADAIEVVAVGDRRAICRWRSLMTGVQIIKTDAEDLIVLSRRDYEALLARAGDEAAEDAMIARLIDERLGETRLPAAVLDRIIDGENPIAVLMAHRGLTQAELSARSGLSQPFISKLVRGVSGAGRESLDAVAAALGVGRDVLEP